MDLSEGCGGGVRVRWRANTTSTGSGSPFSRAASLETVLDLDFEKRDLKEKRESPSGVVASIDEPVEQDRELVGYAGVVSPICGEWGFWHGERGVTMVAERFALSKPGGEGRDGGG